MEAQGKPEPRASQETPALTASLGPQALLANVTLASVPITPVWHKDPTPKMSRGLKQRRDTKSLKSSCIYELTSVWIKNSFNINSVWRADGHNFFLFCLFFFSVWILGRMGTNHQGTISDLTQAKRAAKQPCVWFPYLHASCEIRREITRTM